MSIFHVLLIIYCSACASTTFANKWYQWGPWSPLPLSCSVTCGFGLRCRIRKCLDRYGVVQPTNALCISSKKYGPKAESCVTCVVNTRCPRIPGWSNWGPWSSCRATNTNATVRKGSCLTGISARFRRCNNPPPKPEPYGMSCVGSNREVKTCFYACSRLPDSKPLDVSKLIHLRIEADHRLVRYPYQVILRKLPGEKVTMSCETDAYKLAKRLTAAKAFNAAKKALMGKTISIAWYRNGRLVQDSQANTSPHQTKQLKKPRTWSDRYLDEEIRWNKLTHPSKFQLEDHLLVIPSIDEGDQGFYTCELRYEEYRWLAAFYSLIVIGVRYVAQATDPFYLHSNLGFSNALRRAPVWLESAQIVWQLNGLEQSRGLAVRLARRIQKIEHLNHTHQGTWLCFLAIPAPGPSERMTSPTARIVSSYLINEFHLKINPATNSLWQIAENPSSVRILRDLAISLVLISLILLLLFLLSIWATRRWVNRRLSEEQKSYIVQEVLDNATRLMLTARLRASINKEKLLPLIMQEEYRIKLADDHVKEMLKDQSLAMNPALASRPSTLGRLSALAGNILSFGKSFYVSPADQPRRSMRTLSTFGLRKFSRMKPVDDDEDDDEDDIHRPSLPNADIISGANSKTRRSLEIDTFDSEPGSPNTGVFKRFRSMMKSSSLVLKPGINHRPSSQNTNAPTQSTSPPVKIEPRPARETELYSTDPKISGERKLSTQPQENPSQQQPRIRNTIRPRRVMPNDKLPTNPEPQLTQQPGMQSQPRTQSVPRPQSRWQLRPSERLHSQPPAQLSEQAGTQSRKMRPIQTGDSHARPQPSQKMPSQIGSEQLDPSQAHSGLQQSPRQQSRPRGSTQTRQQQQQQSVMQPVQRIRPLPQSQSTQRLQQTQHPKERTGSHKLNLHQVPTGGAMRGRSVTRGQR